MPCPEEGRNVYDYDVCRKILCECAVTYIMVCVVYFCFFSTSKESNPLDDVAVIKMKAVIETDVVVKGSVANSLYFSLWNIMLVT